MKYPVIILAGHNAGKFRKVEKEEKSVGKVFDEEFLIGSKALLKVGNKLNSSKEKRVIEFVLDAVNKNKKVGRKIIVGPKEIRQFLPKEFALVQQGDSLYENIQRGLAQVEKDRYLGKVLFLLGDTPFIISEDIDSLIAQTRSGKDNGTGVFYAITRREDIREFLIENHLEKYRLPIKLKFPIPIPGKLNKFGFVLKDDKFGKDLKKEMFISGNAFIINTEAISPEEIDTAAKFAYSGRKGLLDVKNWSKLFHIFNPFIITGFLLGTKTISEAEKALSKINLGTSKRKINIKIKAIRASAELALDIDSKNDLERCKSYFSNQRR